MKGKMIIVGSVTYAMKAKELLFAEGIKSYVERTKKTKEFGCGYGVTVPLNWEKAVKILKEQGIKLLAVVDE